MSKKFSITTADYLSWDEMLILIRRLFNDENYKMSLLIALGSFFGLRISDLLTLRWEQILNIEEFTIIEKKTGKKRKITINPQLQKHILECFDKIKPLGVRGYIFLSQKGGVYSVQRINIMLKEIKKKYKLNIDNFSTHSFRKTFGRQVFNLSEDNSEMALILLMDIFNHNSLSTTKRYLGLKDEEIKEVYSLLRF